MDVVQTQLVPHANQQSNVEAYSGMHEKQTKGKKLFRWLRSTMIQRDGGGSRQIRPLDSSLPR
jgi:hypothetical protein